jgi:hypothetical protein
MINRYNGRGKPCDLALSVQGLGAQQEWFTALIGPSVQLREAKSCPRSFSERWTGGEVLTAHLGGGRVADGLMHACSS